MIDLRNKLLSHSSLEGTKVHLLAPGVISPFSGKPSVGYDYAVAKLAFSHEPIFVSWLHDVVIKLWERLRADAGTRLAEVGSNHLKDGDNVILDTGVKAFDWTR